VIRNQFFITARSAPTRIWLNITMGLRPVLISIMALFSFLCRSSADTLDVVFKLTDFDYHPLPGVEVRVVLGTPEDWQGADAGVRFVTDARGQHQFSTSAAMERHLKKRPTNFVSSLTRLPEVADHLQIAAEVEYAGFRWLHVFQIERFAADGDGLQDGYTFYSRDEQGGFTRRAVAHGTDWAVGDLGVLRLNRPAFDLWDFRLTPADRDSANHKDGGRHWHLEIGLKRAPEPARIAGQ
jgi:hypothetical protein